MTVIVTRAGLTTARDRSGEPGREIEGNMATVEGYDALRRTGAVRKLARSMLRIFTPLGSLLRLAALIVEPEDLLPGALHIPPVFERHEIPALL